MAVAGEFRIDVRPYTGYDDPGLPVAAYIAQAGIAGDASGGNLFIDFLFQRSADNQVSELFNLEQLAIDTTDSSNREGTMETVAMDTLAPNRPASNQKWRFILNSIFATASLDLSSNNLLGLRGHLPRPVR